jgi:signal transduction histidine kinase
MISVVVGLLMAYLLLLCLLVLLQDFRRKTNVALALFSALLVSWLFAVSLLQTAIGAHIEFTRFVFVLGMWAGGTLAWFTYELISEIHPLPLARRVLPHGIAIYVVMTVLTLVSPLIISGIEVRDGRMPVPMYGSGYMLYILLVGFTINSIVMWLVSGYRASVGPARQQLRIIAWTLGVSVFAAFLTNVLIPLAVGNAQSALLFPIAVVIMIGGLSYAISRHGLLDIKAATVRSVAYLLSIATMAGIYFTLAYVASALVFRENVTTGISMSPVNVGLALVLAFIFQPIKQLFDRITDKIFYRNQYDPNMFIAQLNSVLTRVADLDPLLRQASSVIVLTLKASTSLFVVYRNNAVDKALGTLSSQFSDADHEQLANVVDELPDEVCVVSRIAATSIDARRTKDLLLRKHIALVVPLRSGDRVAGVLLLGEPLRGGYSRQDIDVLDTIRGELVIAIQNARSVQEVRDLNTTLEQKVEAATRELRASNKRLMELDAMKDEFVSMASHQLRTPLTSVKGYISMVLEGDAGKISRSQRQLLQEAFTSSERMVHLIGDFLNVSRLQTGKFMVDQREADLAEITQQEVANMSQIAVSHSIKIVYKRPARFPVLYLDEGKIRQVIMNFIDNAIYYSPDATSVTVTLVVEDGDVVLRVIDKGMGVPEEAKQKLFTKFFRAENARKQRPDGTGVGLFLAKKVIDGHGGSIVFESTVGKGSTFGFRLPVKKLSQLSPTEEPASLDLPVAQ